MYGECLSEKQNLLTQNNNIFEGNFSLKPLFDNMKDDNINFKPLTAKLIEKLL